MRRVLLPAAALLLLMATSASGAAVEGQDNLDADPENTFTVPLHQNRPAKSVWPELVGVSGEQAKAQLKEELGDGAQVLLVPEGAMMTMDYRINRIRILINQETGLVVSPPRRG